MQQWSSAVSPSRALKMLYKEQLDQLVSQKRRQREIEQQKKEEQRQRYNQRLAQYNQMEKLKELSYKNYYRNVMANQQKRGEAYVSPFAQREAVKEQYVENGLNEQKIKDLQADARRTFRQQVMREDLRNGLKSQLQNKKLQEDMSRQQRINLTPQEVSQLQTMRKREAEAKYKEDLDKLLSAREQAHIHNLQLQNMSFYPAQSNTEHNPLFNPLPFTIQNPYILKEFRRRSLSSNSSYLANVGNNNLTEYV